MKAKKLGVDLGSHSIKIISMDSTTGSYEAEFSRTYYLGEETLSKTQYMETLKTSISNFMRTSGIKNASLNLSVPLDTGLATMSFATLPIVDKKSLEKGMRIELEEKDANDFHHIWEIIEEDLELNEYKIMVSSIDKEFIRELSNLKKVKVVIDTIEIQSMTIGRLIEGNTVVIDAGHDDIKVYTYLDGKPESVNTIPSGGKRFGEIILGIAPDLSIEDVQKLKSKAYIYNDYLDTPSGEQPQSTDDDDFSFSIDDGSEIDEEILEIKSPEVLLNRDLLMEISIQITQEANYIAEEIKRITRTFELTHGLVSEHIYYMGEAFNLLYFAELVSRGLDATMMPLEMLTPQVNMSETLNKYTCATSVALAKDIKYLQKMNFNKLAKVQIEFGSIAVAAVILSIIIHVGAYQIHEKYNDKIQSSTEVQSEQQGTISSVDSEIANATESMRNAVVLANAIQGISKEKIWLSEILYKIPEITPKGVAVLKTTIKNGSVVIRGYSKDYSHIGFFVLELQKLGTTTIDIINNTIESETYTSEADTAGGQITMGKEFTITLSSNFPLQ